MKHSRFFVTSVLALLLGAGAAVGAGLGAKEAKEARAATGDSWYLRGSMNNWTGSEAYEIKEDGKPLVIDLSAEATFKIVNHATSWSGVTELTTATGDAVSHGITFTNGQNSYVNTAGKYTFTVKSGALYADFGTMYYTGDDNSWGITPDADHPAVTVNGSAVTWKLTEDEKFKVKSTTSWDYAIWQYSNLKDGDFYGSFYGEDGGNIVCKIAGDYSVSMASNNRVWTLRIVPAGVNPDDTASVYIWDKYGNLLNTNHYAYTYDASGREMTWPGADMPSYTGTTHVYKLTYWVGMQTVVFNNNSGSQTTDILLSSHANKCLILEPKAGDYDYNNKHYWTADTWVEPETAKYMENYLHFQNFPESDETDGTACKGENGYYQLAKKAYNASTFQPYREELCTISYAVARLSAWAAANEESFVITNGTGSFSAYLSELKTAQSNSANATTIITIVASVILLGAVGGYFIIKRKHEN